MAAVPSASGLTFLRKLLYLLIFLALTLGVAWLGAESYLARRIAQGIAADPGAEAASVAPLREASRIGARIEAPTYRGPQGSVSLPWVEVWATPYLPQDLHVAVADRATVDLGDRQVELRLSGAQMHARFAPTSGLALGQAGLQTGAVTMDTKPIFGGLEIKAALTQLGRDAPRFARAAYDVELALDQADVGALAPIGLVTSQGQAVPLDPMSAQGVLRLYLTGAPVRGFWRHQASREPVAVVGLASAGLTVTIGDLQAVLRGHLSPGPDGLVNGVLIVDTADARGFLQTAAGAGLIPPMAVALGAGLLTGLSTVTEEITPDYPPPPDGEIRLRLDFVDGEVRLAGESLGPAPDFPGLAGR